MDAAAVDAKMMRGASDDAAQEAARRADLGSLRIDGSDVFDRIFGVDGQHGGLDGFVST